MKNKHLSLWVKFLIIGMIPVLTVILIVSVLAFKKVSDSTASQTRQAMSDQIKRVDLSINTHTRQLENTLSIAVADIGRIYDASDSTGDVIAYLENNAVCENIIRNFDDIRSVVLELDRDSIYTTEQERTLNCEVVTALQNDCEEVPGSARWSRGNLALFDNNNGLIISQAVCDRDGNCVGVLALEISGRIMAANQLVIQRIEQSQTTFILDRARTRVYSDHFLPYDVEDAVADAYDRGVRHGLIDVDGISYYVSMQYSATTGWIIASCLPEKELFPAASELTSYGLMLIVIGILAAAVFLMIFTYRLLTPVKELKQAMQKVQGEDLDVQVEIRGRDEIAELSESFNYMISRLRELINQVYVEELAKKNAEMEALQAQINPHFLYNTLDSINWMLIERGAEDISNVVIALGKLMQYSMDTKQKEATLREEYDNIHDYLLLQKNRLERLLNYELELDTDVEDFSIPRLTLQPLVENAIIHGLLPKKAPGTVWVKTSREGAFVKVLVRDDGKGMSKEELDQLRRLCEGDFKEGQIGIQNVLRRIFLRFGKDADIDVESTEADGTAITLYLPVGTLSGS